MTARHLGRPLLALGLAWLVGYPLLVTFESSLGAAAEGGRAALFELVGRGDEWLALWRSLWISVASTLAAAAVGVPLGFLLARGDLPGRRLLGVLLTLPIALPPLVGVIAFLFLYGEGGFLTRGVAALLGLDRAPWRLAGPLAILLVHAYSLYVFFYLFTRSALQTFDRSLVEAAATLGAGRWRVLFGVTLPQLRPALAGAALLAFLTSIGSFSAPYLFGGRFRVMTTQIVSSKLNGDLAMAQAESVALAVLALLSLFAVRRLKGRAAVASGHGLAPPAKRRGSRVFLGILGWSVGIFLLLPHLTLLLLTFVPPGGWSRELFPSRLSLDNLRQMLSHAERLRPVVTSLWMATAATAGALVLGAAAALGARRPGRLGRALEALVALPWAVPGTVFALALATTMSVHQPWAGRLVLVGTPVLLPLAYLVRSLPLTGRAAIAGLERLDPALEEAAATLGASAWQRLWRVTLPLVRPALVAGASVAFITSLGDFVSSILLYTYETRPISMEILSSLRVQETGVAAAYGVLLAVVSTIVLLLWGERAERPVTG